MFLESSRGKYVGFILLLDVTDPLRSFAIVRGHQRSKFKISILYVFKAVRGKYEVPILALIMLKAILKLIS